MKKRARGRRARPELERSSPDLSQGSLATLARGVIRGFHPYPSPRRKLQTDPRRGDALLVHTGGPLSFPGLSTRIGTVKRLGAPILWTKKEPSVVTLVWGVLPYHPRALPELLTLGEGQAGAVGKVATVWLLRL